MNRIKDEEIDHDTYVNKLPISYIQNVRHSCSNVNIYFPQVQHQNDDKLKVVDGQQKSLSKFGNSTNFSDSVSQKTTTNKSNNASISKENRKKDVHPLSLMVDGGLQRASLLSTLNDVSNKNGRKVSKQSVKNQGLDIVKVDQNTIHKFETSKIIISPRAFLLKEIPSNEVTRFRITRESNILFNKLTMFLEGEREVKINCFKYFKLLGTRASFKIDDDCNKKQQAHNEIVVVQPQIGWVESCFDGSIFNVYEKSFNNQNSEMVATIEYFKDSSEDGRHYGVKIYYRNKKTQSLPTNVAEENFKIFHEKNPFDKSVQCLQSFIPLSESVSNISQNGLDILLMSGKKKCMASIHNILFVDRDEKVLIKFYKIQENQYYLQCFGGISSFIGCAFAYSSFVFKMISR